MLHHDLSSCNHTPYICSMKFLFCSLLQCWVLLLSSADLFTPIGAQSRGLGYSTLFTHDVFAVYNNPSGMRGLPPMAGLYVGNSFGVSHLHSGGFAAYYPFRTGGIGATYAMRGNADFNLLSGALSFNKSLSEAAEWGVQIMFHSVYTAITPRVYTPAIGISALKNMGSGYLFSVHIHRPAQWISEHWQHDFNPSSISMGLSYIEANHFNMHVETTLTEQQRPDIRWGMRYKADPHRHISAGLSWLRKSVTLGYQTGQNVQFHFSISYHQVLAYSASSSFTYSHAITTTH
jgi:hypothetical protein